MPGTKSSAGQYEDDVPGRHYATGLCGGRTAFQAELLQLLLPGTSYPVTIATLSSAFQAQKFIYMHLWLRLGKD